MFKKIFLTLLVFALFPMIIVTVLFYGYFSQSIHSEITTGAVNTLKNIDAVDERIVEERISDVLLTRQLNMQTLQIEKPRLARAQTLSKLVRIIAGLIIAHYPV